MAARKKTTPTPPAEQLPLGAAEPATDPTLLPVALEAAAKAFKLEPAYRVDGASLVARARKLQIVDDDTYELAADGLKDADEIIDAVEKKSRPLIDLANKLHKGLLAEAKESKADALMAKGLFTQLRSAYRAQKEEQARLAREALERAQRKAEEDARAAEAKSLRDAGHEAAAAHVETAPITTPSRAPAPAVPKTEGLAVQEYWSAEIIDLEKLIDAVSDRRVPMEAIEPNMTFLNAQARSLKTTFNWPGVRAVRREAEKRTGGTPPWQ